MFRIRDCQVVLLTNRGKEVKGWQQPAPYVDEYGETDQGFKFKFKKILIKKIIF